MSDSHEMLTLRCLVCAGELASPTDDTLVCQACGTRVPVVEGIPRFVPSESYARSFGIEWKKFSLTQLDTANGTRISYHRFRMLSGIDPAELRGKRVLDVGCGTGRFMEIVARAGAETWGVDLSVACEVAARNTRDLPNAQVIQADLHQLPFGESFDLIYSFGVLHHTPSLKAALAAIARHLKPGGRLVVWVYNRRAANWIPRPHRVYGRIVKSLPESLRAPVLKGYTHAALAAGSVPLLGRALKHAFPIQDLRMRGANQDGYEQEPEVEARERLRFDWAHHSAYDGLTPTYIAQTTPEELVGWAREAGLVDVRALPVAASVTGRRPS